MKIVKASFKNFLRRNIVVLLIAANVGAFTFTNNIFSTLSSTETNGEKTLISQMYTGWQMLDWSFSLIDYLKDITDR